MIFELFHVEKRNPADSTLAVGMAERHMERYGCAPKQVRFDGVFASRAKFDDIKRLEADDVVFTKGEAITVEGRRRSNVPNALPLSCGYRSHDLIPEARTS